MSLTLSGCLGRAQLGAAELGAFQTVTTGAGFLPIFPDVGPLKQAQPPEEKRKKKRKTTGRKAEDTRKVKRPKKPKRVKIKASEDHLPTQAPVKSLSLTQTRLPEPAPVLITSVDTAAERLRETIAEEDELLLLIC